MCDFSITEAESSEGNETYENDEECEEERLDKFGLTDEERSQFCAAFTLLDTDGDGLLLPQTVENILVTLSREAVDDNIKDIMSFATAECDEQTGMDFDGFYEFLAGQLVDTNDEARLREAFDFFRIYNKPEEPVPPGLTDLGDLRKYLKFYGLKLTDEEIDYLWEEENYWMLDDRKIDTEYLVQKLLGKEGWIF